MNEEREDRDLLLEPYTYGDFVLGFIICIVLQFGLAYKIHLWFVSRHVHETNLLRNFSV